MTLRIHWLLLINAMLGQFLAGLSSRIFMISLPSVANGLGSDILGIAWALISFQLAGISLSIVFGRLGDIYGRETIYALGFFILTVSSFLCGISQNVFQLIVFRFLQGVGGAMTQSASRALAMDAMPEGSEGKAQGLMTMAFHSGFFIGPPAGGFIIDYVHWRAIFFVIVLFGLVGIALSAVGTKRRPKAAVAGLRPSVDYLGAGLLIVLTIMLTLLLDRKSAEMVGVGKKGLLTLVFVGMLWGFLAHENKAPSPMIHLPLFRIQMFTYSVVSLFTLSITRGLVGFLKRGKPLGLCFVAKCELHRSRGCHSHCLF